MNVFGLIKNVADSPVAKFWKMYGRPTWEIGMGVADISLSRNKKSAVLANTMSVGAAFAVRSAKGWWPFIAPTAAYITGRLLGNKLFPEERRPETGAAGLRRVVVETAIEGKAPTNTIASSNEVNPIDGFGEQGLAKEQRQDFGSGWKGLQIGISGSALGWLLGGWKGAALGGIVGTGVGYGLEKAGETRNRREEKSVFKSFIRTSSTALALDVAAEFGMGAFVRGGLLYKPIKAGASALFGEQKVVDWWLRRTGRNIHDPAGFLFNISDWFKSTRASYAAGETTNKFLRKIEPLVGNPELIRMVTEAGGVENIARSELLGVFGKNFLKGLPISIEIGLAGMLWTAIKNRHKKHNKPINPIKGHDAGRWGREQTFASGDFEPGSSIKDLFRFASKEFAMVGSKISSLYRGLEGAKATSKAFNLVKSLDVGDVAFGSGVFTGLAGTPGAISAEVTTANVSLGIAARYNVERAKEILGAAKRKFMGLSRERNIIRQSKKAFHPGLKAAVLGEVEDLVRLSKESPTLSVFRQKAGVVEINSVKDSIEAAKRAYPAVINPKEIAQKAVSDFENLVQFGGITRGSKTAEAVVGSEKLYAERGMLAERVQAGDPQAILDMRRLGGGVTAHEKVEQLLKLSGKADDIVAQQFRQTFGHAGIGVPYAHGAFYGGMGLEWSETKRLLKVSSKDWKFFKKTYRQGWETGKNLFSETPSIVKEQKALYNKRVIKRQLYAEQAAGIGLKLNEVRCMHTGVERPKRQRLM